MDPTAFYCPAQAKEDRQQPRRRSIYRSLLGDADWSHRLGSLKFKRCLNEVLGRRDINGVLIENVLTEPLLEEVIATMADQEAKDAANPGTDPDDHSPTSPADGIGDDEPTLIRI